MKKVLVTGEFGYIGSKFKEWIEITDKNIDLEYISLRDDSWRKKDLSLYDSILHLAGIAHVSRNPKMKELYYKINKNLTVELAEKAKKDGVKHFIFMSSIIVYGDQKKITMRSIPNPKDFYGDSKLQAEVCLNKLKSSGFKVSIIRPPMVYGENSKGNYKKLSIMGKKIKLFPYIENRRSMIYVYNLCEFIRLVLNNEDEGTFFPQNEDYVSTSNLVKEISVINKKSMKMINVNSKIARPLLKYIPYLNKAFGDLYYDKSLSLYAEKYNIFNFSESISRTEINTSGDK